VSDFKRLGFFDQRELVGARWWQEHLAAAVSRRDSLKTLSVLAVGLLGAGAAARFIAWCARPAPRSSSPQPSADDLHVTRDAIDLQRSDGWDVGRSGEPLSFASSSAVDIDGGTSFESTLLTLAQDMTPAQPALAPYYVPTLFQSVSSGTRSSDALRAAIRPMRSEDMDRAFAQGAALASLFSGLPNETAVIVDMPGPQATAFAAGMAESFDPVFAFDNWPHPVGVVKSHDTLAAVLYYAPLFRRLSKDSAKPPAFVLDSNRLTPYTDDKSQFDNRYLAKLPSMDGFAKLGIKHLLYVTDGAYKEADDLNDDFVAWTAAGLGPKMVNRSDFTLAADADAQAAPAPEAGARFSGPRYYYGGYPYTHFWFWHTYGWYSPPGTARAIAPRYVSPAHDYSPVPRTTLFSGTSAGGARTRPGGFGRVSVTASRQTGQVTSTSYGRSGSFGRSGAGGGGGYGGGYSG
jgi:hypothetical protein